MDHWILCLVVAVALTNFSGIILFSGIFLTGIMLIGFRLWDDFGPPETLKDQSSHAKPGGAKRLAS
jgi:hypothetical protein